MNNWETTFIPWNDFPEYELDLPIGFQLTAEEQKTKERFNLNDKQIYWRRKKIDEMNGNVSLFEEEYPLIESKNE